MPEPRPSRHRRVERPSRQRRLPAVLAALAALAVAAAALRAKSESDAPEPARPPKAPATQPAPPLHAFRDNVKVEVTDDLFIVHSNGIPDHDTGKFPNEHNPNTIREQNYTFKIPRHPKWSEK